MGNKRDTRSGVPRSGNSQSWGGGGASPLRFILLLSFLFLIGCASIFKQRSEDAHAAIQELRLQQESIALQIENADEEKKQELFALQEQLDDKIRELVAERETYDNKYEKEQESSKAMWGGLIALALAGVKALGGLAAKGAGA